MKLPTDVYAKAEGWKACCVHSVALLRVSNRVVPLELSNKNQDSSRIFSRVWGAFVQETAPCDPDRYVRLGRDMIFKMEGGGHMVQEIDKPYLSD